jgi:hypothetical protein
MIQHFSVFFASLKQTHSQKKTDEKKKKMRHSARQHIGTFQQMKND